VKHFVKLIVALLSCTALLVTARAQETLTTASVTGRVMDSSGAVIPNATVKAVALATNQSYTATTDTQGRFRIPFLAIGVYTLSTQPSGFALTQKQIQLTVGGAFDVTLQVGVESASSSVNVIGQMPVLEENRSQISETVLQEEVNNLPYNGRNFLDLSLLTPGVSPTNTASVQTFAETSPVVGQGYSVNSQRNFSNSFVVDGLSANDDAAGLAGNSYSMDVIREFQVVTSGGQAEFGRAMGGYFARWVGTST
jgi:hypothetical protein